MLLGLGCGILPRSGLPSQRWPYQSQPRCYVLLDCHDPGTDLRLGSGVVSRLVLGAVSRRAAASADRVDRDDVGDP